MFAGRSGHLSNAYGILGPNLKCRALCSICDCRGYCLTRVHSTMQFHETCGNCDTHQAERQDVPKASNFGLNHDLGMLGSAHGQQ